jgi:lysozyme family protein
VSQKINRLQTLGYWTASEIKPSFKLEFATVANNIMKFKPLYDEISVKTGIPFYVIGALDSREEDFDHNGYLGNGDPLDRPTTHVPQGRGPFATWQDGAIDALDDGFSQLPKGGHWDIVTALIKCEEYNGLGYHARGLPSPYVWAGTSIQRPGKYTSDHGFDPNIYDMQPGCAGIFLTLKELHGVDLSES